VSAAVATARPWSDAFRSRMRPRPRLTVSEWADRHRVVPPGTSPEPGAWRTDRVPYLREILDAVSDPDVERIYVQAASQVAKSEILLNTIGFFAQHDPSPILLVQSTEDAMKGFSKERVAPMFEASPALRGLLEPGERNPANTTMLRQFPGGLLACAWAGSAASLASRPIRVVLGDELDRWPDTTGRDGDPWAQAVQRTSNFFNRKILAVSTPTVESFSAIARLYDDSDQRRYHVPCPRCGVLQVLEWSGVIYKREDGTHDLDQVHYRCAHCAGRIEERERPAMLAAGEWRAENPDHRNRGYHISALYSPWVRWSELAAEWIKANAERDKRGLQEFVNLRLGEAWTEESERITVEALEKNREPYESPLPDGALVLTAGVDVQDNRLEAEVVGWGIGRESWGVEYVVIPGDTSLDATWHRLDEFLQRTWARADGRALGIWCAFVDSGGHRTQEVYKFCGPRQPRNVYATKGYAGQGRPLVGKMSVSNQQRVPLFPIGADTGKEAVYSRLALERVTPEAAGPGFCHFPIDSGYDDEFFKGLVSEKRVTKMRAGRSTTTWQKTRARNEPLDIRVLATAALEVMMPDTPGSPAHLPSLAAAEEKARGSAPAATQEKPQRRRVLSRGVDG
jgi:phage terminase large subunit GpA-like protein